MDCNQRPLDLIVTIVRKGHAETVIDAARKAGAEGGTTIGGRGTGIHEQARILGIPIEPEKEIVLILLDKSKTDKALDLIYAAAEFDKPGRGLAFVLDVEKAIGIRHIKRALEATAPNNEGQAPGGNTSS